MKNSFIFAAVAVVIVLVGGAYFIAQNEDSSHSINSKEQAEVLTPASEINDSSETIDLVSVDDFQGTGMATRDFNGNTFVHTVIAQLDDPADDKFYEGWLVKKEPDLTFISTGRLEESSDGEFVLFFDSDTDYSDYSDVVITEETQSLGLDNNPEAHVLTGTFE